MKFISELEISPLHFFTETHAAICEEHGALILSRTLQTALLRWCSSHWELGRMQGTRSSPSVLVLFAQDAGRLPQFSKQGCAFSSVVEDIWGVRKPCRVWNSTV